MRGLRAALVVLLLLLPLPALPASANPGVVAAWHVGSSGGDSVRDIALMGGATYVGGYTDGTFAPLPVGAETKGDFIQKLSSSGVAQWTVHVGQNATVNAVAAANNRVCGAGGRDGAAFVACFDSGGTPLWNASFGSSDYAEALDIAVDATNVFVVGYNQSTGSPSKGIVYRFSAAGGALGNTTLPSGQARAYGIALSGGSLFVAGETAGTMGFAQPVGREDGFLAKLDLDLFFRWARITGTVQDELVNSVAADDTLVAISGMTWGAYPNQTDFTGLDGFVQGFDLNGTLLFTDQFGGTVGVDPQCVALDFASVAVVGTYQGTMMGRGAAGSNDAFLIGFTRDGTQAFFDGIGGTGGQSASALAFSDRGALVGGSTNSFFPGQQLNGTSDGYLADVELPPAALMDADLFEGNLTASFTFTANGSLDRADGTTGLSYRWDWDGGGTFDTAPSATPWTKHTFTEYGTFNTSVQVQDADGGASVAHVQVLVRPDPLTLSANSSALKGPAPLSVQFNALPQGGATPITIAWDFGDTDLASGVAPSHTFAAAGDYLVQVRATDKQNKTANATVLIHVFQKLSVNATVTPTAGRAPLTIQMSASMLAGAPPYVVRWATGNGGSLPLSNASNTYTVPGVYNVTLTVTDAEGQSFVKSFLVDVSSAPDTPGFEVPAALAAIGAAAVATARRRRS